MKHLFTSLFHFSFFLFTSIAAFAAKDDGKNVMDVWFGSVPAEAEKMLTENADKWHFGFRPVSKTATSWLWSDPIMQQRALNGESGAKEFPTAVTCCLNYDGFSFVIYTVQPDMKEQMEKGSLPDGSFEIYFAEGDTDMREMKPYFQFWLTAAGGGHFDNYPWAVYDRRQSNPAQFVQYRVRQLENGYVHVLSFPWEAFWNKLPMKEQADNFWRMTILRWTPQAWLTWGGAVHEASRFGYLRFPQFTAEQKSEIRQRLLKTGWTRYQALKSQSAYNTPSAWGAPWPLAGKFLDEERAKCPETYTQYTQDPEFQPILAKLNEERQALAKDIANFKELSAEEQEAFFAKAAPKLFNYRYDVEAAYTKFLNAKLYCD